MLYPDRHARHLPEHLVLSGEVVGTHRVVQDVILPSVVGVGAGGHHDHRQPFGGGAGHTVQRGVGADVEGGQDRRRAIDPGVSLGGIGRVELVATTDLLDVLVLQELIKQDEVVVPGDHEVVLQPDLLEPGREVLPHGEVSHDLRSFCFELFGLGDDHGASIGTTLISFLLTNS